MAVARPGDLDDAGLSSADAAARLLRDGPNAVPPPERVGVLRQLSRQLRDPLILVLLGATVVTVVTGDFSDAAVILLVIIVNTTVGVVQEIRADRAIDALSALSAPRARVVRDAREQEIPAGALVPGDLLVLAEGDLVPADARVCTAAALLVDESSLTGESVPVDKTAATSGADGDPATRVAAGTAVLRGRGRAVVTATGPHSASGRIASLLDAGPRATPLQRRLLGLGRTLAVVVVALCVLVLHARIGARAVPRADGDHGDQPGGGRGSGVAAGRGHPEPGARGAADGGAARDRSTTSPRWRPWARSP